MVYVWLHSETLSKKKNPFHKTYLLEDLILSLGSPLIIRMSLVILNCLLIEYLLLAPLPSSWTSELCLPHLPNPLLWGWS